MSFVLQYGKEIFAFFVPVLAFLLNKFFKNNAKICYGGVHQFTYLIPEPLISAEGEQIRPVQTVHTHSYVLKNEGRESGTNVEVTFNFPPMYLNVWPSRHYETKKNEDNRSVMVFDYLAPKEAIRCEIMSINKELPELLSVRCKEGVAKQISLYPQKSINPILSNCLLLLMFLGSISFVYFSIVLLQWLITKTG